jgi:hypothetical protein
MRIYKDKNMASKGRPKCFCLEINWQGKRIRKYFETLVDANKYNYIEWIRNLEQKPCGFRTLLKVAIGEYIANYQKRYPGSRTQQIENRLSMLLRWYPDYRVEDLKPKDIARKIENKESWKSSASKGTAKTIFQIFLKWCSHNDYASERDWTITLLKSKAPTRTIGILTPDQTWGILHEVNERYRPAVAIMLFAGIRPLGEMSKLDYSDIRHGDSIDVPESKTPERLITDLPENLWSWVPDKSSGLVMPGWEGMNQSRRRACKRLGFKYPSDGARHSFGTYAYWIKGMEWTMHTMGHANYNTFQKHYRNKKTTKEDAENYFNVTV